MSTLKRAFLEMGIARSFLGLLGRRDSGRRLLNLMDRPRGVYASFEEAALAAKAARSGGHEHPDPIAAHQASSGTLRPSDYAVLHWLRGIGAPLRIFDFGGNVGNLYYSYKSYLTNPETVNWTVYDLPAVIEAGRILATERAAMHLSFVDQRKLDPQTNVVLISGAFHYWEKSVEVLLDELGVRPPHLFINRSPMHDRQQTFTTVQLHPRFAVPCIVHNSSEVIAAFDLLGYELVDRWPVLELSLYLPLFPDWSIPSYTGFYFRRRATT
jgi:putative methyltransferase (TIGR04325 family)